MRKGKEIYYPTHNDAKKAWEEFLNKSIKTDKNNTIANESNLTIENSRIKIKFIGIDLRGFLESLAINLTSDVPKDFSPLIGTLRKTIKFLQSEEKKNIYKPERNMEKYHKVKILIEAGKTFKEIGDELGCSASRVHQMWEWIQRWERWNKKSILTRK